MKQPFKYPTNIVPFNKMITKVGLPTKYNEGDELEDFTMNYSPTAILETIGQIYGVHSEEKRKIWEDLIAEGLEFLIVHNK